MSSAALTNQGLIESRLYEYFDHDIIVKTTFWFVRALNFEWRRVFMMADLRDQASALVMNGLCWAQSISGGESENAIPQLEMIHSVKPRFLECQPLQSSHINNKKIRYEWTSEVISSSVQTQSRPSFIDRFFVKSKQTQPPLYLLQSEKSSSLKLKVATFSSLYRLNQEKYKMNN